MPICFDHPDIRDRWGFREPGTNCIEIGLVNNMPSGAMEATERQFRTLLEAAAAGIMVRLSFIALPEVPRSIEGKLRITRFYSGATELWNKRLDGLIVTGAEPIAASLADEPYWGTLKKLLEWAECNTRSAIWSCLAAHAAVLHCDGIERRQFGDKLSGVFECARVSDDALTTRFPGRSWMPHSRWNDIPETALAACGYRVLIRSGEAGACAFTRAGNSLFLFFQGHPEYEPDSLFLEYRRDVRRFLRRERETYPAMPRGCFDESAARRLTAIRERALSERSEQVLEDFPTATQAAGGRNAWRPAAVRMYRNWLLYLCAEKARRQRGVTRQAAPRHVLTGQPELERTAPATAGPFLEDMATTVFGGDQAIDK